MTDKEEKPQRITLIITTETLLHSIVKDVITISTVASGIILNTLTINITWLNFWLGLMALVYVVCRGYNAEEKRVIRGKTADDVITKLRTRLTAENFK